MPPELDLLRELNLEEALQVLEPAAIFAVGIAIYAIVVFNLYRYMPRKDIFNLDFSRFEESKHPALSRVLHLIFYVAKYVLLFPLVAFAWFGVLVVMVAFLSKTQEVQDLLLIAMAVLSSIRVTSYYTEDLSRDIAKILPFALLGIFLIDLNYFELEESLALLEVVGTEWRIIVYFWLFIVALELVLRVSEPYFKALYTSFTTPPRPRLSEQPASGSLAGAPGEPADNAPGEVEGDPASDAGLEEAPDNGPQEPTKSPSQEGLCDWTG